MKQALGHNPVNVAGRIEAIDKLRGLVMVLMALDHTRDFFSDVDFDPTDLTKTSAGLFLTRWITHFCAPTFIFLAGTSAFLSRGQFGANRLSRFLLTRGLWITFLGLTFETVIWSFTPDFSVISGSVLWAIGWSMVCLSLLVFLPLPMIVSVGIILIAGHNAFDALSQKDLGSFEALWAILHTGEKIQLTGHLVFEPYYPLVPWIGVMAVGYGFGSLMSLEPAERNRKLYLLGSVVVLLFIGLRYSNIYGDPRPWASQGSATFTLFSFINCDKYPPSLCYLLMTLGPAIAFLPLLDRLTGQFSGILQVFGQTPMFFYLLHLPLIILFSLLNALAITSLQLSISLNFTDGFPHTYGYGLPVVYLVWIVVLSALYPLCNRFNGLKRRKAHPLLRYL